MSESRLNAIKAEIIKDKGKTVNFERLRNIIEQNKRLEATKKEELSFYLKVHMENLENGKRNIKANLTNLEAIQNSIIKAKQISKMTNEGVNNDQSQISKLMTVKSNLNIILERLGDFLNISAKLEEMELMIKDEINYPLIQVKLDKLNDLKRSLMNNSKNPDNMRRFLQKFEEVDAFQERFIIKVLDVFDQYLQLSRERPDVLKDAIYIIEQNDKIKNSVEYTKRMKQKLETIVEDRFEFKLGGKTYINEILENMRFSVSDLLVIYENVVPLFSEEYSIFNFLESCYKTQIKSKILPFIENLDFLRENPGTLVYLINWLDSYEKLLSKVGFSMGDFEILREEVKNLMPIFFKHISNLLTDFLARIDHNDDIIFQPDADLKLAETETPEDIATFLNQQVDFLASHLQGEMFNQLFEVWSQQLNKYVENTVN